MKSKTTDTSRADTLFSRHIRGMYDGMCWAMGHKFDCSGYIQCCHIISRRYRALRWAEANARPMCSAHHLYFTHHPLEWEDYCRERGIDWNNLRYMALHDPPEKAADALARLKEIA